VTTNGSTTVELRATDNAGNISSIVSETVRVDKINPVTALNCPPAPAWSTADVTCTVTATDAHSGVSGREYRVDTNPGSGTTYGAWTSIGDGGTFLLSDEGIFNVQARSTDNAGRTSTVVTQVVSIDKTDPQTSVSCPPAPSWSQNNVTCTGTFTDPGTGASGVATQQYRVDTDPTSGVSWPAWSEYTGTFDITEEGQFNVNTRVVDNAGRVALGTAVVVRVDKTDPNALISCGSPDGQNGWFVTEPTCAGTFNDPGDYASGLAQSQYNTNGGAWQNYTGSLTPGAGQTTYNVRATDVAGRQGTSSATVSYDPQDPTAQIDCGSPNGQNDWYTSNPTCTFAAGDAHSGVQQVRYQTSANGGSTYGAWTQTTNGGSMNITAQGEGNRVRLEVTDNAGRTVTANTADIKLDRTSPTVALDCPGSPAWQQGPQSCTVTSSDATSGVQNRQFRTATNGGAFTLYSPIAEGGTVELSTQGQILVDARATDNAGLTSSVPRRTVRFDTENPTVTMINPGNKVKGTVNLDANAADVPSAIQQTDIQYSPGAQNTWTSAGVVKSYPQEVLEDAPSLYWRMNEPSRNHVFDETTNLNHGTALGVLANQPGNSARSTNTSFDFDGVDDHITRANHATISPSAAISIEAWIRPDSNSGTQYIVNKVGPPASYYLYEQNGRPAFGVYSNGSNRVVESSTDTTPVGQWTHILGTYDGSTLRLYANGVLVPGGELNHSGAIQTSTGALFVGSSNATTNFFDGRIDEVAIYGSALSGARIAAHANNADPYRTSFDTTSVEDGTYDFRAIATDLSGRQSTSATQSARIDNRAPSVNLTGTHVDNTWYRGSQLVTGNASDTQGGTVIRVWTQTRPAAGGSWTTSQSPCDEMQNTGGQNYQCTWDSTQLADGDYDLRLQAIDNHDNTGTSPQTVRIRIDNTNPTGNLNINSDPVTPSPWLRGTATSTSNAADAGSGVQSVQFQHRIDGSAWTTACTDTTVPYDCTLNTLQHNEGTPVDTRVIITDNVGNTRSTALNNRMIDNTAPGQMLLGYNAGWINTNPNYTLSATGENPGSGRAEVQWRWNNGNINSSTTPDGNPEGQINWSQEGIHTLETRTSDNATNQSSWNSREVRLDTTAPTRTISGVPGSWVNANVSFVVDGQDNQGAAQNSGINQARWRIDVDGGAQGSLQTAQAPGGQTITDEGRWIINYTTSDNAGNANGFAQVTARIDKSAPTDLTTAPQGWQSGNTNITLQGSDALSGLQRMEYRINGGPIQTASGGSSVQITDDGITTLSTRAIDNVDLASPWTEHEIRIDKSDPELIVTNSSVQWFNVNRNIGLEATDGSPSSGIERIEWQYVSPSGGYTDVTEGASFNTENDEPYLDELQFNEDGDRELRARAVDHSGRTSGWKEIYVRIDKIPPQVTMSAAEDTSETQNNQRIRNVFQLNGTGFDTLSGIGAGQFEVCRGEICAQDTGTDDQGTWELVEQGNYLEIEAPRCVVGLSPIDGAYQCNFDSRRYANGSYYLRFRAFDLATNESVTGPIDALRFRNGATCPVSL
jgi:large repetitive protein